MKRALLWQSLLTADMNVRYWKRMVDRYTSREKRFKIFLAITSSTSVAGWAFWQEFPFVWKVLSVVATIISIALPILNHTKLIEQMTANRASWWQQKWDYEELWERGMTNGYNENIDRAFSTVKKKELHITIHETSLPEDRHLLDECQHEVLISRKLTKT